MNLSEAQQQMIADFARAFPVPTGDAARMEWTHRLAEQFRYSYGATWGHKSAGPGRPHSKDAIAYKFSDEFWAYDCINGATGQVITNPAPIDIHGQIFEPVAAVNHLGSVVQPEPEPPPSGDLEARVSRIEDVLRQVGQLLADV